MSTETVLRYTIKPRDIDDHNNSHLRYDRYVNYFDQVRKAIKKAIDLDDREMKQDGVGLIVTCLHVDYGVSVYPGQKIEIHSIPHYNGKARIYFDDERKSEPRNLFGNFRAWKMEIIFIRFQCT